jgi:hypothetical protein
MEDSGPWESITMGITRVEYSERPCFEFSARVWSNFYGGWRTMTVVVDADRIVGDFHVPNRTKRNPIRYKEILRMLVRDLELWDPK